MKRLILLVIIFISFLVSYSQKTVKVSATYTYRAPETMSVEEAKRTALESAKIQAIADEFGTKITQANTSVIITENEQSQSNFYFNALSEVKGEWVEIIGEPKFEISFEERCVVVTCEIIGIVKELTGAEVEYEILTLKNAPNLNYATTEFDDGDDLYLYFKSPVAGYLSIFLINENEKEAYCLLPYKKSKAGSFYIESDKEYYLFTKEKEVTDKNIVDEYTLSTSSNKEFNDLLIVFSPKEYNKSNLKIDKNLTVPRFTTTSKFNDWLSKLKLKNNDITTSKITLTISKR